MSAAMEVSEGIPVDRRVFNLPQDNSDAKQSRFLANMGNFVTPKAAKEKPWQVGGGIEVANPCLRHVRNFLRKGRISPLLTDTHEFQSYDVIKKIVDGEPEQYGWFRQQIPAGYVAPFLPPARGGGYGNIPSPTGNMVGKITFPGDQIGWITGGPANITNDSYPRGIVEITVLKGYAYNPVEVAEDGQVLVVDRDLLAMNRAIFPRYPFVPVLVDEAAQLLDAAWDTYVSLREVIEPFQQSLQEFTAVARVILQNTHATMKESGVKGRDIAKYTELDLVLLEQLGMDRQDREIKRESATSTDPEMKELLKAWLADQREERAARVATDQRLASLLEHRAEVEAEQPVEPLLTNATPAGQEAISVAMADVEQQVETPKKPQRRGFVGAAERIQAEIEAEKAK